MKVKLRGGAPNTEIEHGKLLLDNGTTETWGWNGVAGKERVYRRVRWISTQLNLSSNIRVLECGCGTGVFTREIVNTNADITAVDISRDLLEEAKVQCLEENVTFKRTNLEKPVELKNDYFDAIYGVSVLHHLNLQEALPALFSKLKPGGHCVFSEPNLLNPINKYYLFVDDIEKRRARGVSPHEMAFTYSELKDIVEKVGFKIISLEYRDFMHPSVPPILVPVVQVIEKILEKTPIVRMMSGSLWLHMVRPDV